MNKKIIEELIGKEIEYKDGFFIVSNDDETDIYYEAHNILSTNVKYKSIAIKDFSKEYIPYDIYLIMKDIAKYFLHYKGYRLDYTPISAEFTETLLLEEELVHDRENVR